MRMISSSSAEDSRHPIDAWSRPQAARRLSIVPVFIRFAHPSVAPHIRTDSPNPEQVPRGTLSKATRTSSRPTTNFPERMAPAPLRALLRSHILRRRNATENKRGRRFASAAAGKKRQRNRDYNRKHMPASPIQGAAFAAKDGRCLAHKPNDSSRKRRPADFGRLGRSGRGRSHRHRSGATRTRARAGNISIVPATWGEVACSICTFRQPKNCGWRASARTKFLCAVREEDARPSAAHHRTRTAWPSSRSVYWPEESPCLGVRPARRGAEGPAAVRGAVDLIASRRSTIKSGPPPEIRPCVKPPTLRRALRCGDTGCGSEATNWACS